MFRRTFLAVAIALLGAFPHMLAGSEELNQRLKRIYDSPAFHAKRFGPARWIKGGAAFTTLESAPGSEGSREQRRYRP
jgi:hypothetical protein